MNTTRGLPYRLEIVPDEAEGGYVASYPELRGCLTVGDTAESAAANAGDAKREWLTAALEDGYEIPEPQDEYSGQFKLRIPKSLHRDLALHAKREGISMNQYCLYLLARNDAEYDKTATDKKRSDESPAFFAHLSPLSRFLTFTALLPGSGVCSRRATRWAGFAVLFFFTFEPSRCR